MPYEIPRQILKRWFPYGYTNRNSVSLGLFSEVYSESGGGQGIADLEIQVASLLTITSDLATELDEVKAALALHENNGKHWTQAEIDGRADVKVADHVTALHP